MSNEVSKGMQPKPLYVSGSLQIVNLNWIEEHPIGTDFETNPVNRPKIQEDSELALWVGAVGFSWIGIGP
jgi:hypothetical protein